jgi:peptide/nickel transport system permease protein
MRSLILSSKNEEYILFDKAKGLNPRRIMWHAFRNALLPQTTGLALSIGNILGGSLLTEAIFAYPGMGWLLYNAVINLDYPLIQGIVLTVTIVTCLVIMILDLIYPLIDPRIKLGGE